LEALEATALNSLYAELLANGRVKGAGGLSPSTVHRIHATVHRALRDAVRWGHLDVNAADLCNPPRARLTETRCWSAEDLRAFLGAVRNDELRVLWTFLAMTGVRRGEALGLRWVDVDLGKGHAAITQTLIVVGGVVQLSQPKTRRARRVIALDGVTARLLARHRRRWGRHSLVFSRQDGTPRNPGAVTKRFAALVRGAGMPPIRLHDLRHTNATLALRAGVHPKVVSERLGHATVTITLDLYSHAVETLQQEAAARVSALVFEEPVASGKEQA
jgi:integrase